MPTICIRDIDATPLLDNPRGFDDLRRRVTVLQDSRAGGFRTLQVDNSSEFQQYVQRLGLGMQMREDQVPFPPRSRWTHEANEQMTALIPVPQPITASSIFNATHNLMQTWTRSHPVRVVPMDGAGQAVAAQDPNVLTLVFNSVPEGVEPVAPTDEPTWHDVAFGRYGMQLFSKPAMPDPTASEADNAAGFSRRGNTIYIRFPITEATRSAGNYVMNLLRNIQPDLSIVTDEVREQIRARARAEMVRGLLSTEVEQISSTRRSMDHYERDAQNNRTTLTTLERGMQGKRNLLVDQVTPAEIQRRADEQFLALKLMDKVNQVRFEGSYLYIETTELVITNPRTRERHVGGSFQLRFSMETIEAFPDIRNLSRNLGRAEHPHIQGGPCWGSMQQVLPPLMQAGEYPAVVSMVIAYLETCNPDDAWGRTISLWPTLS